MWLGGGAFGKLWGRKLKNYHFLKEGENNGTLQRVRVRIESVTEMRRLELERVINAEKVEGLEFVENMKYLCSSGK